MSCRAELKNYQISHNKLRNDLAQKRGFNSWSSADRQNQHEISLEAAKIFRPIFHENEKFRRIENSGVVENLIYHFTMREDGNAEIIDGEYAGKTFGDLDKNTKELTPDQYRPSEPITNLLVQEHIKSGANEIITSFLRDGNDNRDLAVFIYNHETKIGTMTIINTAPDGNFHDSKKIKDIATNRSPNLNLVSPTDQIFLLTDKAISKEQIEKVIKDFEIKEKELSIKEILMRFDPVKEKVYADGKNKEIDIELQVCSEAERKQKHRLVRKIQSCHSCAVKEGKAAAFFYAPDNLYDSQKQNSISQILVSPKGDVTFKTINLPDNLTDSERNKLLLKLGYKKDKTPRQFSYTDDPVPDAKMKKIVEDEITALKNKPSRDFISLQVIPIVERFDFLRQRLSSDRIIANSPVMYLHDITLGERNVNKKSEKGEDKALNALLVFGSNESESKKIKIKKIGEKSKSHSFLEDETKGPGGKPQTPHQRAENDNNPKPAQAIDYYVGKKINSIEKQQKQKTKEILPENTTPPAPSRTYLEENKSDNASLPEYFITDKNSPKIGGETRNEIEMIETAKEVKIKKRAEKLEQLEQIKPKEPTEQIEIEKLEQVEITGQIKQTVQKEQVGQTKQTEQIKQIEPVEQVELIEKIELTEQIEKINRVEEKGENEVFAAKSKAEKGIKPKENVVYETALPEKIIFPIILNLNHVGERVIIQKEDENMEKIWTIFLNLYFPLQKNQTKNKEAKKRLHLVAEEEIKTHGNFFQAANLMPYTRIFAILLICILTLSRGI